MREQIDALRRWLLDRPQLLSGPYAGAVRGSVGEPGPGDYAYPEITGYYLSWLAFLGESRPADAAEPLPSRAAARGLAAAHWLRAELARPVGPRTRLYCGQDPLDDWRNHAVFSFDVGMVYRGAAAQGDDDLRASAALLLATMVEPNGSWRACRVVCDATRIPQRWSTGPGPHLLKVAGGVLAFAEDDNGDAAVDAAVATLKRFAPGLAGRLPEMSHPALYALEGVLQTGQYPDEVLTGYRELGERSRPGLLSENATRPDSRIRSDVLAQWLRIGVVLAGRGDLTDAEVAALAMPAEALLARIDRSGALGFGAGDVAGNTWCAMFAHQALVFYERLLSGRPIPQRWIQLLV